MQSIWVMKPTMRFYQLSGILLALSLSVSAYAITPQAFNHYKNGQVLERTGDLNQAEQAYRMAIALDPTDSLSYIRLANVVKQNNRPVDRTDEAISLLRTAAELSPTDKMIHYNLGQLLEKKGQPQQALAEYLQATDGANWQYPFTYLALGRLQSKLNDTQRAMQSYNYFLKFYPDHPEAIRELQTLTDTTINPNTANTQQPAVLAAIASQQPIQAGQKMPAPVKLYMPPQNFGSNLMPLPLVPQQLGQPVQEDIMVKAMEAELQGQLPLAIQLYKQAIQQAPQERYPSYLTIADIAQRTGNAAEIKQALGSYQQFEPNNPSVLRGLGEMAMQEQNYPEAIKLFSRALTLNNDSTFQLDVRKQLAYALQMNNEYTLSASHYEKILKEDNDPVIKRNLALAYQQAGQLNKALPIYRQIVINEPQGSSLRSDMGQLLIGLANQANQQGYFKEADQYITEARQVSPSVEIPNWGRQKQFEATQVAVTPSTQTQSPYGLPYNNTPTILVNATPPKTVTVDDEPELRGQQQAFTSQQPVVQKQPLTQTPNKVVNPNVSIINKQDTWQKSPVSNTPASNNQSPVTKLNNKLKETVTGMFGTSVNDPYVAPKYNSRGDEDTYNNNPSTPTQSIASALPTVGVSTPKMGNLKDGLEKAKALIQAQQYEPAAELLEGLHQDNKASKESYLLLGDVHKALNNSAQAETSYENALAQSPNDVGLLSNLAAMQRQNGSLLKAEQSYKKLSKLNPDPDSYYQLGVVQHLNKNFAGATDSFNQAIALNPKWKDAYYGLGIAEESNQNYDKAIMAFEKYMKLSNPLDPTTQAIKKHVAMLYNYNILSSQKPTQKDPAKFNVEEY